MSSKCTVINSLKFTVYEDMFEESIYMRFNDPVAFTADRRYLSKPCVSASMELEDWKLLFSEDNVAKVRNYIEYMEKRRKDDENEAF